MKRGLGKNVSNHFATRSWHRVGLRFEAPPPHPALTSPSWTTAKVTVTISAAEPKFSDFAIGNPIFLHQWALGDDGCIYRWQKGVFVPKYVKNTIMDDEDYDSKTGKEKEEREGKEEEKGQIAYVTSIHVAKRDNTVFVVNSKGEVYILDGEEKEGTKGGWADKVDQNGGFFCVQGLCWTRVETPVPVQQISALDKGSFWVVDTKVSLWFGFVLFWFLFCFCLGLFLFCFS